MTEDLRQPSPDAGAAQSDAGAAQSPNTPRGASREVAQQPLAWTLFALTLLVYLVTAKGFSDLNDAEAYYLVTKALVERGAVDVEPELTEPSTKLYFEGPDGKLYAHFGIGFPLFAAPLYVIGQVGGWALEALSPRLAGVSDIFPRVAVTLGCALVAAGSVALLYLLLLRLGLGPVWAVSTALMYAFTTYVWAYSKIGFYDIHLVFFEVSALLAAVLYRQTRHLGWCLLSGFSLAWGTATRPTLGLALPILTVYLAWAGWRHWQDAAQAQERKLPEASRARALWALLKPAVVFGLGMVPWLLIVLWYNSLRTGVTGDFGYPGTDFIPTRRILSFLKAVYGNSVSPGRGFFVYSPTVLLMFWGIGPLWRRWRAESLVLWPLALLTAAFFCARPGWETVWPWGPRYLLVLTPLVMLPVGFALPVLWARRSGRALVLTLLAVALVIQILSIVVPFGTFLHYVKQVAGSPRVAALNLHYIPILGQVHTLERVRFDRVPLKALRGGYVARDMKMNLRHSLDFWFIYAYRLGVPAALWVPPLLLLLAATGLTARRLQRQVARLEPGGG